MRERYEALIAHPDRIEATLLAGADKARQRSAPFMRELRQAVGLRALDQQAPERVRRAPDKSGACRPSSNTERRTASSTSSSSIRRGLVLLQSTGYASPRDAGQAIARLQTEGGRTDRARAEPGTRARRHIRRHRTGPAGAARRRRRLTTRPPLSIETGDLR
jgi:tryptophanyl-tRNA synthetase